MQSKIFFLAKSQQEIDPLKLRFSALAPPSLSPSTIIYKMHPRCFNISPSHHFSSLLSQPLCSRSSHLSFLPSAEAFFSFGALEPPCRVVPNRRFTRESFSSLLDEVRMQKSHARAM